MKLLVYMSLVYVVSATAIPSIRDLTSSKVLKLPFKKTSNNSATTTSKNAGILLKRSDGKESFDLKNQKNFYSVDLAIGTPAQNVTVLLDTGSSDLWITGSNNPYCKPNGATGDRIIDCSIYGTFDTSKSSTFHNNNTDFSIAYGDGSFAKGSWAADALSLNGVGIKGLSFAVANSTDSNVGVLGIGLPGLETTNSIAKDSATGPYQYPNLPIVLKNSGIIKKVTYSLYLDSPDAPAGSILFGGVDSSKFTGNLYTLPIINIYEGITVPVALDITLQGLGLTSSQGNSTITTSQIPVLLDSGTTLTYFPAEYVALVAAKIGATDAGNNMYSMNCPSDDDDRTFVFDFGGFHITAPLSSFLVSSIQNENVCYLGMVVTASLPAILGDLFLTNAYIAYDLETYEVSMAQASYDSSVENLEVIIDEIPHAVKASGYSNTWAGNTKYVAGGDIFTLGGDTHATATQPITTPHPTADVNKDCSHGTIYENFLCKQAKKA